MFADKFPDKIPGFQKTVNGSVTNSAQKFLDKITGFLENC